EQGDAVVAAVRRTLLAEGRAVLGRAVADDGDGPARLWLKATLLHPNAATADLLPLLDLVTTAADRAARGISAAEGTGAPATERLSP
ncbi:aspartate aminotransferase family protein, partial [Streptomyces sp. SID10692]|nr:aspartate aminotransferase family protein [Streptomyces sp. SID10692]